MAEEYGIRIICANLGCAKDFFIALEGEEPLSFSDVEEAFRYRERLVRPSERLGPDSSRHVKLPERFECPECHSVFLRSEVTYLVARLPEGTEPAVSFKWG